MNISHSQSVTYFRIYICINISRSKSVIYFRIRQWVIWTIWAVWAIWAEWPKWAVQSVRAVFVNWYKICSLWKTMYQLWVFFLKTFNGKEWHMDSCNLFLKGQNFWIVGHNILTVRREKLLIQHSIFDGTGFSWKVLATVEATDGNKYQT